MDNGTSSYSYLRSSAAIFDVSTGARPACPGGAGIIQICNIERLLAEWGVSIGNSLLMLHDDAMSGSLDKGAKPPERSSANDLAFDHSLATDDRRRSDRVPFPAELIMLWNHDASMRHRYRILDAGDGGYRIRTALPLLEGTTGMVIRVLSGDMNSVAQAVMVAWCKRQVEGSGCEVGLRLF